MKKKRVFRVDLLPFRTCTPQRRKKSIRPPPPFYFPLSRFPFSRRATALFEKFLAKLWGKRQLALNSGPASKPCILPPLSQSLTLLLLCMAKRRPGKEQRQASAMPGCIATYHNDSGPREALGGQPCFRQKLKCK